MKQRMSFVGLFCSLVIAAGAFSVSAQTAMRVDDFNYPVGQLTDSNGGANVSNGIWVTNTGTGNFLQVSAGSLSYTGYPSSGVGNKLEVISTTASAEDTFRNFAPRNTGTVYAAFMINVANTTGLAANSSTTGDYFAGLIASNSTTNFANRVTIRAGVAADTYQIGFRATGNAGNTQAFSSTDLPVGTTALIVISYQIVAGATNDVCNLWVNPVITGAEPTATISQVSAADSSDIGRFFIRQGSAGTPNASIDGIRIASSWAGLIARQPQAHVDFNGDGRSDYAVTRNEGGLKVWYGQHAGATTTFARQWGLDGDVEVPFDYDGDGKSDIAVWRRDPGPNNRAFYYILNSSTGTFTASQFGSNSDDPDITGDYDGDGKADLAVFRANGTAADPCGVGKGTFYYRPSGTPAIDFIPFCWGQNGDEAVPGDYDGDGKYDFVIGRLQGGQIVFYVRNSSNGTFNVTFWGRDTDAVVPGDYDGDGRWDFAVARPVAPSSGEFYILEADGGGTGAQPIVFGNVDVNNDQLAPGDYDGDGRADVVLWKPGSPGTFIIRKATGQFEFFPFGQTGDKVVAEELVVGND